MMSRIGDYSSTIIFLVSAANLKIAQFRCKEVKSSNSFSSINGLFPQSLPQTADLLVRRDEKYPIDFAVHMKWRDTNSFRRLSVQRAGEFVGLVNVDSPAKRAGFGHLHPGVQCFPAVFVEGHSLVV